MSYTDRFRVDARTETVGPSSTTTSASARRLITMIERACNPTMLEPNLGLNLEIVDIINQKKGTYPREAAVAIVKLVNSRTPQTSILALGLLDVCVKNCGYPFHLQISRKEFLNELVRKFPEKPPISYSRTQQLILEAIEEWNQTICRTSRYRDDLGYIRDMHRLLSYKGYVFPEINQEDAAVLNPSENLRSAHELEQEEREAQSAKLQELIRRATPADLQEANRLMSVMAGFRESKTDYHAKAAKELDKVRRKADILDEMLQSHQGDLNSDDVFGEIVVTLKNARPKIQKMVEEERDSDEDATVKLLALNDYINSLIQKYDLLKAGDSQAAGGVSVVRPSGGDRPKTTASKQQLIESLIDIDQEPSPSPQPDGQSATTTAEPENLIDALDGLSFGNIALGQPQATQTSQSQVQPQASGGQAQAQAQAQTQAQAAQTQPQSSQFGSLSLSSLGQSPALSPTITGAQSPALTPAVAQSPTRSPAPATGQSSAQSPAPAEEWSFSSAVPQSTTQSSGGDLEVLNASPIRITFSLSKAPLAGLDVKVYYSNTGSTGSISNLSFQLAVPKGFSLQMKPQSGTVIAANTANGITQDVHIDPSAPPKLRWKVAFTFQGTTRNLDGQVQVPI